VPWSLFAIPAAQRAQLDAALKDDTVSRQSQKVRDAAALGGPAGETYVLVEGSADGVRRADELLTPLGKKLTGADGDGLYAKFKAEEEAASAGMGLFFTEE
jgi:3-hydroxyisobutyrate dehydrogenase-like beta-hydroxyacid dehydrogenase